MEIEPACTELAEVSKSITVLKFNCYHFNWLNFLTPFAKCCQTKLPL